MSIFKNRTVVGVICILAALVICFGITPLFNRSISQKEEIVRVTKAIDAGEQVTADMVQTVEVGAYNLPDNILHDTASVVGKYAAADLAAGDYILPSKISDAPAAENSYLYNLDGTKQAMSVTIKSFATGLSGDGGITKTGAGTLKFTAGNAYTGATTIASGMVPASIPIARPMSSPRVPPELGRKPNPISTSSSPNRTRVSMTGKPISSRVDRVLFAQMWVWRPTAAMRT